MAVSRLISFLASALLEITAKRFTSYIILIGTVFVGAGIFSGIKV